MFNFENLLQIDFRVSQSLFNLLPHNQLFFNFFSFMSLVGSYAIIWLVILAILVYFEAIEHKDFIVIFFASLLLTFLLVEYPMKNYFKRERPINYYLNNNPKLLLLWTNSEVEAPPQDYSFPSGHTAIAFCAATVLSYYLSKKSLKISIFFLAALIAYSRIYLGVHFLGDILGGVFVGCGIAGLILTLKNTVLKKILNPKP